MEKTKIKIQENYDPNNRTKRIDLYPKFLFSVYITPISGKTEIIINNLDQETLEIIKENETLRKVLGVGKRFDHAYVKEEMNPTISVQYHHATIYYHDGNELIIITIMQSL